MPEGHLKFCETKMYHSGLDCVLHLLDVMCNHNLDSRSKVKEHRGAQWHNGWRCCHMACLWNLGENQTVSSDQVVDVQSLHFCPLAMWVTPGTPVSSHILAFTPKVMLPAALYLQHNFTMLIQKAVLRISLFLYDHVA